MTRAPKLFDKHAPRWVSFRVLDKAQPYYQGVSSFMREGVHPTVQLLPRDVAIFHAICERMDWAEGVCPYSLAMLAEEIGMDPKYVIKGFSRLKGVQAVVNARDPVSGKRYILINPSCLWSGTEAQKKRVIAEWEMAWEKDGIEDVKASVDKYVSQRQIDEKNRRIDAINRLRARQGNAA